MDNQAPPHLTEQHLIAFGTIVQWFARHEALMQEMMATVSGADAASIKVLTAHLDFAQTRDALFRLLRHRAIPFDRIEQIRSRIQILDTFAPLRHDIVHSVWIEGKPQNSIWPAWLTHGPLAAIRPSTDVPKGRHDFIEDDEDKIAYTLEELNEISGNLASNYIGFREYAVKIGLAAADHP